MEKNLPRETILVLKNNIAKLEFKYKYKYFYTK